MENKKNTDTVWMGLKEFVQLSGLEEEKVLKLIEEGTIESKKNNDILLIEATSATDAIIKRTENNLVSADMSNKNLDPIFVEKTINTILGLHDKVIAAKNETISAYKNENLFLKDAIISTQEVYEDDKKTIDTLREELKKASEEIEFIKRKYRLMWGKVSSLSHNIQNDEINLK
ncbi:DUF3972 domain-containing protein [Helicobacter sp. 13S00477-4]|uniref:DUF3972 domain-containing protein n=1 Tax=Helicobacter sp. 13S00477-4 TaxID=1905759 RepID=UPI000BA5676B|nr:DUF3972 domain-containing protein [Helicobacter sp. 13S00477-4]PAF52801.1 hypothetical protein BKH44_01050 [Helicobacter sp. 13S00477-4]